MNPDTIRALAEALTQQLMPLLPYLFTLPDRAWEEVGKKPGGGAVEGVKKLWGRVLETPDAEKAARKLSEGDSRRAGTFEAEIEDILKADTSLAETLARLLECAGPRVTVVQGGGAVGTDRSTVAGQGGVAVGHNHYGDIYIGRHDEGKIDEEAGLREAYLRRLMKDLDFLDLSGVDRRDAADQEAHLQLHAIYTALLTESAAADRLMAGESRRRQSALSQLNEHQYLVLLGDPGSGKSTFVSFVALCLAGEQVGDGNMNLKLLTQRLPSNLSNRRGEEEPWDHSGLLPVRVLLRDLAAGGLPEPGETADACHLWSFIEASLRKWRLEAFAPLLDRELREKGGLLLLDGLDEVLQVERRREQIRQAVLGFCGTYYKCRVLVTSRTYAYQDHRWRLPGFSMAALAPFTNGQISGFVKGWYHHLAVLGRIGDAEAGSRAAQLEGAISASPRLRDLAEKPLLLTLMASLHAWRSGTLPEKREQLYAEAVDLLLDRWERRRSDIQEPSLAEWLKLDSKERIRSALERLAYTAHKRQPDLSGTADIAEEDLLVALLGINRNPEATADPTRLLKYLCHRAGLLTERQPGVYTFPHRTLQEYLAACHLTEGNFPQQIANLARTDPYRWREVALLAAAKAARGAAVNVWSLAASLCWREPHEPEASWGDVWGAHLAGQAVVESVDLGEVGENGPNDRKLDILRCWHARLIREPGFPATERSLAGKILAYLGDLRFDPKRWFLPTEPPLGFLEVPAGPFLMGSAETDDEAQDDEKPQHKVELPTFYLALYPVTVAQFREFVEGSGYEPEGSWWSGSSNAPVTAITWHEALAYCRWLGEQLKELPASLVDGNPLERDLASGRLSVTLPSEAEWEKAARGTDGRIYPWGDKADPDRASYDGGLGEPSTVGCFPGGVSPLGFEELSGNVWEWTRSLWGEDFRFPKFRYPYITADGREELSAGNEIRRVLRGGSYDHGAHLMRAAARRRDDPGFRSRLLGFRVALTPKATSSF